MILLLYKYLRYFEIAVPNLSVDFEQDNDLNLINTDILSGVIIFGDINF